MGRTYNRAKMTEDEEPQEEDIWPLHYRLYIPGGMLIDATPEEAADAIGSKESAWVEICGIKEEDLPGISAILGISEEDLKAKLFAFSFPGVGMSGGRSVITLWEKEKAGLSKAGSRFDPERHRIVIVRAGDRVATLSCTPNLYLEEFAKLGTQNSAKSFGTQVVQSIIRQRIDADKKTLEELEKEIVELEKEASKIKPSHFLDKGTLLKKRLQQETYSLRYLSMLFADFEKGVGCGDKGEANKFPLEMHDEAKLLEDRCEKTKEDLKDLIDLEMNRVSFKLNQIMRFLAIISCLALVPAIIGGLLGQNLLDQPFKITLPEIVFFVFSIIAIILYVFSRQKWLK